ncbi:MAG: TetR/AcrR family transcriptional regulator [Candidatus Obscuribacterales bacterium]|nr:TetR/AcrR family transcriptional regulator [Candidatus Obscuribacterales bacterium]
MGRAKSLENRTEVVLVAARELFGRYGFEKTTIEDIAREAGIGKGSVYLEFPTKQDILMAIVRNFVLEMRGYIEDYMDRAEPPYLDALEGMLLMHVLNVHGRATSQIHTPDALLHTSIRVRQENKEHFDFMASCFNAMLKRAAKNGEIKKSTDFQSVTDTLLLGMGSLCPPYLRNTRPEGSGIPGKEQLKSEARALISLLIAGIRQKYGKNKNS